MVGTRSSARKQSAASESSQPTAGSKRKGITTTLGSKSKRGKKGDGEKRHQTNIQASLPKGDDNATDEEMKDVGATKDEEAVDGISGADLEARHKSKESENDVNKREENVKRNDELQENGDKEREVGANGAAGSELKVNESLIRETEDLSKEKDTQAAAEEGLNGHKDDPAKANESGETEPEDDEKSKGKVDGTKIPEETVKESSTREDSTPSSVLEKGIIYFFFRGRVGINEPSNVDEIARSYIVLRPIPHGANIVDGPIGDAGTNRLLALPKKVLPTSAKDRFMIFVEKANTSMEEIKSCLAASDYATKTAGARHTPSATPIGEGVYAITKRGHESHLAYILTIPSELGEVQKDVGLQERASFVTTVKNPQYSGPVNTNLPQGPSYPPE